MRIRLPFPCDLFLHAWLPSGFEFDSAFSVVRSCRPRRVVGFVSESRSYPPWTDCLFVLGEAGTFLISFSVRQWRIYFNGVHSAVAEGLARAIYDNAHSSLLRILRVMALRRSCVRWGASLRGISRIRLTKQLLGQHENDSPLPQKSLTASRRDLTERRG